MKKQFAIKSAKSIKAIKSLAAKYESANTLGFSVIAMCCADGPVIKQGVTDLSL